MVGNYEEFENFNLGCFHLLNWILIQLVVQNFEILPFEAFYIAFSKQSRSWALECFGLRWLIAVKIVQFFHIGGESK